METSTITTPIAQKAPLLNEKLKSFMVAMVAANIAGSMYGALLPLYLTSLNADIAQVGLFFTLSQMIPLALQIVGGYISDSLGRLRSIAIASVLGLISYVGLILAPSWEWVLIGEGFGAMCRSLVGPSFGAFIAEQSSEDNRAKVYGMTDTIYSVVGIIGPPLGGFLAGEYGFKFMLACSGLLYLAATIIRVRMARDVAQTKESKPEKLSLKGLKASLGGMMSLVLAGGIIFWMIITDGARDAAYTMSFTLLPVFLEQDIHLTVLQISTLESVFSVAMMAMTMPGGWLADKKGERLTIVLGFFFMFLGMSAVIFGRVYWNFACAWALLGLGVGLASPAYNSLISKAVPERLRGMAMGVMSTSLGIFSLPAPWIGSQLWTRFNARLPYVITAAISGLAIIPVWMKFKLPKTQEATPAVES
jgi:DHA1 family multidrug resistance protein-like MFS transporter